MTGSRRQNTGDVFPTFHLGGLKAPTRGPDAFTVTERPFHRGLTCGVIFSRTLWGSEAFRRRSDVVRRSTDTRAAAWEHAGSYAAGSSQGRRVVAGLFVVAGTVPPDNVAAILELIWLRPIVGRSEPAAKDYRRVTRNTLEVARRGSELIARRGAGICIVPGCDAPRTTTTVARGDQYYEASGPVYCAEHDSERQRHGSDSKAVEHAFTAVAAAWPTLEDRELLRWWWARRGRSL